MKGCDLRLRGAMCGGGCFRGIGVTSRRGDAGHLYLTAESCLCRRLGLGNPPRSSEFILMLSSLQQTSSLLIFILVDWADYVQGGFFIRFFLRKSYSASVLISSDGDYTESVI